MIPLSVASAATAPAAVTVSISKQLAEWRREYARKRPAKLHPGVAFIIGLGATTLTIWLTILVLHNIHPLKRGDKISWTFVELVILPLATTTIENVIAVLHARRGEMERAIQTTIVCSIEIALFVMPLTICGGWVIGLESMTLQFNDFQVVVVFLTVLIVTSVFQGPNGRW